MLEGDTLESGDKKSIILNMVIAQPGVTFPAKVVTVVEAIVEAIESSLAHSQALSNFLMLYACQVPIAARGIRVIGEVMLIRVDVV